MTVETSTFTLSTNDDCLITLTELNHNVVSIQPVIHLNSPNIPHTCIQEIIDHIISLNRDYIKKLYFENIKFKYRFISFNLFGQIRSALKNELKKYVLYDNLVSDKDNYKWIEQDFLPKMTHTKSILDRYENKVNKFLQVISDGELNGVYYNLYDVSINFNYVYDLDPIELIPIVDTYVRCSISFSDNSSQKQQVDIINGLNKWFNEFDMNITFI